MTATASSTYHASSGEAYQQFLGRWTQRLAERVIDAVPLPEAGDLLDVGCGTGSLAAALAARYPGRQVVGVDIAEPYVAFARARQKQGNLTFELGDAMKLRWPDGQFAGSFAQLALNFVPSPATAAAEMRRVTRRDGTVAGAVWDFRGGLVYQRLFWDTAAGFEPGAASARDRLFSHPLATADGLMELWRSAGLAELQCDSVTIRMDFADFADYWEPLLGGQGPVGTYVTGLAPAMRQIVRENVLIAYLSGAADGPRSMTATAWVVCGTVP